MRVIRSQSILRSDRRASCEIIKELNNITLNNFKLKIMLTAWMIVGRQVKSRTFFLEKKNLVRFGLARELAEEHTTNHRLTS